MINLSIGARRCFILLAIGLLPNKITLAQASQAITEIVTDYGGYFKSGVGAISTTKPNNSHNLLAFTYNGVRYATGVNNTVLTSNGLAFQNTLFRCLPMNSLASAPTANTKAGLGALYDGVLNGPSNPTPTNNIPLYLTDGISGLNLGTGIANLPAGTIDFNINIPNASSIGDGVPDIVITQIADPSSGTDQYSFLDASNQLIGTQHSISFSGISAVANWTADFYEASTNPMTLGSSFTQTDRPLRLWAADFSYFGITAANYSNIVRFRIQLNGNSDIAFIAYNSTSSTILPVSLSNFNVAVQQKAALLSWDTYSEINASHFEIERSIDGINFYKIATQVANGNTTSLRQYNAQDRNLVSGIYFYRLKIVDIDGAFKYSDIKKAVISQKHVDYSIFPNPSVSDIFFMHPPASVQDKIQLFTSDGKCITTINTIVNSTQTEVLISKLSPGIYVLVYTDNKGSNKSRQFVKL